MYNLQKQLEEFISHTEETNRQDYSIHFPQTRPERKRDMTGTSLGRFM